MSWALKDLEPSFGKTPDLSQKPKEPLNSLLIVQGKRASEQSKAIIEPNRMNAATTMMHETLNGFSVFLVGGILESDKHRLFRSSKMFQRRTGHCELKRSFRARIEHEDL